jgi:hypothetical protein
MRNIYSNLSLAIFCEEMGQDLDAQEIGAGRVKNRSV